MLALPRIVEINTPGRRVRLDRGFLAIADDAREIGRIGIDTITAVMATTPAVSFTGQALAALAEHGAPVVLCGTDFRPASYLLPVSAHHASGNRIEVQAAASAPCRKRLWQQIVRAKLTAQADALARVGQPDMPVRALVKQVASGDTTNREATGAQRYFPLMFGKDFRRNRDEPGINAMLNYGYTVLRSAAARSVVAAGLHPALGLQHRSRGDGLRLADDLMEPFRPAVDLTVRQLVAAGACAVDAGTKPALVGVLALDYATAEGTTPLTTVMARLCIQLAQVFEGGRKALAFPKFMVPLAEDQGGTHREEAAP